MPNNIFNPSLKALGFLMPPILARSLDFEVINFKLFLFALIGSSTQNTKSLLFKLVKERKTT